MNLGGRRFLIVGHRGAAARAPENTAASLTAGLAGGADQIEIDVGITRDGRVVLLHDTTLDRTTNGRGRLRARSWSEVEKLDAGSWCGLRFAGERPIDLDDALAIVRPRARLIVEVKPVGGERATKVDAVDLETIEGVINAFRRSGGFRGVTMSSAGWTLLQEAASRAKGLDVALTVRSRETRDPLEWAQRIGATALHPSRKLCTPEFVARARGIGLLVIPYTVNNTAELAPLLDAGVDGVFTDDPTVLRRALSRRAGAEEPRGPLTMGIDQGSGGTRAVLIDAKGAIVASQATRVASRTRADGTIVQDAEAIAASVAHAAGALLTKSTLRVASAGLAVQRSSILVWRRKDAGPVTPVLSWRSRAGHAASPELTGHEAEIRRATGLTARYPYGAIRLAALIAKSKEIASGLHDGSLVAGPLGAFLAARLTDRKDATTDPSLAQRTLAYDYKLKAFSPELAALHGLAPTYWPEVAPSIATRGNLRLGKSQVPLEALLGDVGAAARALLDDVAGSDDGALVLGTGGFVVVPTGRSARRASGLLTTVLYEDREGPVYALEGTVHGLAAGLVEAGRRGGWEKLPVERIAARSGGALRSAAVVAALEGTGTPDWDPASRFEVEDGDFTPEEIVRGTIDDLASRFGAIAGLLRASHFHPPRFIATGGLALSPHLTSKISEATASPVAVDPLPHRTAVGAALLARDGR